KSDIPKFTQIHSETSETLKHSLSSFNATVTELENLQSTRLELEDLLDELIKLQRQVYGLGKSKKYMKILSPQKALVPYTQLMQLAHKIKYKNEQVGYSIKNLDAFLQQNVDALWDDMKSRLSKKFQQTLDSLNWPTPIYLSDNSITSDNLSAFINAFMDLLILQQPIESMTDPKYLEPGSSSSKENSNSTNN
ncbi:13627_t:CDS:2, partial [Entrophospora sp. SA101]